MRARELQARVFSVPLETLTDQQISDDPNRPESFVTHGWNRIAPQLLLSHQPKFCHSRREKTCERVRRQLAAHDLTSELTSFWARLNVQLLRGETFAFQNLQKTTLKKAVSVCKPDDTYLSEYSTWEPCIASSGVLQTSPPLGTTAHSKTLPGTGCTFRIETGAPPAFGISRCCTPEAEHLLRVSSRPAVAFISESTQHDTNQPLEPFCCLAVRGSWWRCVTAHSATDSPARRSCRPL